MQINTENYQQNMENPQNDAGLRSAEQPISHKLLPTEQILQERYKTISWQNARDILITNPKSDVFFNNQESISRVHFIRKWQSQLKLFLNYQCTKIIHLPLDTSFYVRR